ncbi:hypothetical protein KW787_03980 [Candidatus Pacearchaeota archaeon]|nr:hypothetical protein [Candidatus Pacearchaeota archaeon]
MGAKQFDYYVFIDYSENLLGYLIIEKEKIQEFIAKISKFAHYRELKHKHSYLHSIKKVIEKKKVLSYPLKTKIRKTTETPEIYSDILEFLNKHKNCLVFISVDNKQYSNFERLVKIINGSKTKVVRESELKKDTFEYRISLVLDTLLNLERLKDELKRE